MANTDYVPFNHYLVKQLGGISFPTTKGRLREYAGDMKIQTKPGKEMLLSDIVDRLAPENYECATAFYCAVTAVMEKYGL